MSNNPNEIVLCEDKSTSVSVSKSKYGGSTQGPTLSSTSGFSDQGKSMKSASVSVEVNNNEFLPETNYPLRKIYRMNTCLGTYDLIPASETGKMYEKKN